MSVAISYEYAGVLLAFTPCSACAFFIKAICVGMNVSSYVLTK